MRRLRKVKILATLGPASSDEGTIQKLHEAGADLFRINMSHSSHDMMRTLIQRIRNVEKRCGHPIGILADLQGPKLRVGKFAEGSAQLMPDRPLRWTRMKPLEMRHAPSFRIRKYLTPCDRATDC